MGRPASDLADFVFDYIAHAFEGLQFSNYDELSIIGYCMGNHGGYV